MPTGIPIDYDGSISNSFAEGKEKGFEELTVDGYSAVSNKFSTTSNYEIAPFKVCDGLPDNEKGSSQTGISE